jgi:hypothetical protein
VKFDRIAIAVAGILGGASLAFTLSSGEAAPPFTAFGHATPTPLWAGMLGDVPAPFASPLPPVSATPLDGEYARLIEGPPQWWSCLRCADYRPTGGIWRLLLDQGVLRLVYDVTRWKTLASYTVESDRLRIFNDPMCPYDQGTYQWEKNDSGVELKAIDDDCAFGLRARNLATGVWQSCEPPDARAAVSDAWGRPPNCSRPLVAASPDSGPAVQVAHIPGDARQEQGRLSWTAPANAENVAPPPGVAIDRAADAVTYGLNVVLWEGGPWVEMTTDIATQAVGVQFWGPSSMGLARILFDGEEVWRGEVAQLGQHYQLFGGYVEVSGFPTGRHTLRVEHLGADGRPVTVLLFGGR